MQVRHTPAQAGVVLNAQEPRDDPVAIQEMRDQALLDLLDGPVTPSNLADIPALASRLNGLMATAIVSWLCAEQYVSLLSGARRDAADVLLGCADTARGEIRDLARRICELGYSPQFDPVRVVAQSHTCYREFPAGDSAAMVAETLRGRRIVIQLCQEYVRWVGIADPSSRRLIERILEQEETDASKLRGVLHDHRSA